MEGSNCGEVGTSLLLASRSYLQPDRCWETSTAVTCPKYLETKDSEQVATCKRRDAVKLQERQMQSEMETYSHASNTHNN